MNAASTRCSPEPRRTSPSPRTSWPSSSRRIPPAVPRSRRGSRTAEHAGDEVTHEIMIKINTTFVTPFDREDIYRLASALDDVMDAIEEAADLIVLYRLGTLPDGIAAQVEVLQRAAAATAEAMPRLQTMAELQEYWIEVNSLENEATRSTGRCWATCSPRPRARRLRRAHGAQDSRRSSRPSRRPPTPSRRWPTPSSRSPSRSPEVELAAIIVVIVVALAFDYTNGFHDAANAIATSVSTRALTPRIALIMAAVMNFVGAFLGTEVAHDGRQRDHRRADGRARPGRRARRRCSARSSGTSSPGTSACRRRRRTP